MTSITMPAVKLFRKKCRCRAGVEMGMLFDKLLFFIRFVCFDLEFLEMLRLVSC